MVESIERARVLLAAGLPVMLVGESGVGKSHAARELAPDCVEHNVSCLPEGLAESVLFGHKRGAFSGAVRDHKGLIARAAKGTLFLDEICALAPALQPKFLSWLDTGHYLPVGATRPEYSAPRMITATNRDPWERVRAGAFREDLAWRLAPPGSLVMMPPLRERPGSIISMAGLFAGSPPSRALARVLMAHPWPGNVRELRAVCRAAVALGTWDASGVSALLTRQDDGHPTGRGACARAWARVSTIMTDGPMSRREIEDVASRGRTVVALYLREWQASGCIERTGAGKLTRYRRPR